MIDPPPGLVVGQLRLSLSPDYTVVFVVTENGVIKAEFSFDREQALVHVAGMQRLIDLIPAGDAPASRRN